MDKQFGKGSVLLLGSRNPEPVATISSGSLAIDNALGVGGFPRGRVVEVYGPESSGKTTLTLHVIAEAQKAGGVGGIHRRRTRTRSRLTPDGSASISTTFLFRSPTAASRHSRSPAR